MSDPRTQQLFKRMVELGASDLHLTAGCPPTMRINEDLRPVEPVMRISPFLRWQVSSMILTGRPHSSKVRMWEGSNRIATLTDPRCMKTLTRKRPSPSNPNDMSISRSCQKALIC